MLVAAAVLCCYGVAHGDGGQYGVCEAGIAYEFDAAVLEER